MKKIIAVFTLFLAFGIAAHAQEGKKATPESAGQREAVELTDFLKLNSTELDAFSKLFAMKHQILNDPTVTEERKKEMSVIVEKKLEASLDGNQMEKLRANQALFKKLTH